MSRGEGIKQLPNKKWQATCTLGYDSEGKQIRKSKTFDKKGEATKWRNELQLNPNHINLLYQDIRFSELSEFFMNEKTELRKKERIAASTLNKYRNLLKIINTASFYNKEAGKITPPDIELFLTSLVKDNGFAKSYITEIKLLISAIFSFGMRGGNKYIYYNPAHESKTPRAPKSKAMYDSYTPKECKIIKKNKDKPFGDIVYFMISCGPRPQEVCATNEDFLLHVNSVYYYDIKTAMKRQESGTWKEGETKTEASERANPIKEDIAEILENRFKQSPVINGKHYLLPNSDGTGPISYNEFLKKYKQFIESIGIRYLPPKYCRHTFASQLKRKGVPTYIISRLMGHTKENVTFGYIDIATEDLFKAIKEI